MNPKMTSMNCPSMKLFSIPFASIIIHGIYMCPSTNQSEAFFTFRKILNFDNAVPETKLQKN